MVLEIQRYPADRLHDFGRRAVKAMGATDEEALIVSDALLHGSLHGHPGQGQGYNKLPRMWRRVKAGSIKPGAKLEEITSGSNWVLLEGNNGFGPVVARGTMNRAIEFAKKDGIGLGFVRGSNHLTSSGFHAMHAANQDLFGLCMTNAGPELAPWGGTTPVLGTNPWGIAVPTNGDFPLLLDIALTQSGKGMVRWYMREGQQIPTNWAYAPDGTATDDPELAMQGPLVPMGEYKGVGLSLMTDVLCGVLIGAAFGKDTFSDPKRHNVGHFMLAIDPDSFLGKQEFFQRLADLAKQFKSSDRMAGVDDVYLPGEIDYKRKMERLEKGIPVDSEVAGSLVALADELEVEFTL